MGIFGGLETKRFTKNPYFYTETLQVHKFESSLICKFLIKLCVIFIINSDFNEIIRMSTPAFTLSPTCTSSILGDVPLSRLIMAPAGKQVTVAIAPSTTLFATAPFAATLLIFAIELPATDTLALVFTVGTEKLIKQI